MVGEPGKNMYYARVKREAQLLLAPFIPKEIQKEWADHYIQEIKKALEYYIGDDRRKKTKEAEGLIKELMRLKKEVEK